MVQEHLTNLKNYFSENKPRILDEFFTFLRFQSISSEPEFRDSMHACVEWLKNYIQTLGFQTEIWKTDGHPILFATNLNAGPSKPTLLIYNHYDVQPIDPLELWESPPFEPEQRGQEIFARGAQDNKGQCFYVLQALKAMWEKEGQFPINIKLCIEGEEEMGSISLAKILPQKKQELKADYLAVVDMGINHPTEPAVTLGIRGIVTMDVEVSGSSFDLHSGSHGGIAYNPLHALSEMIAKLRDENGKIQVPHFYEDVGSLSANERSDLALNFHAEEYKRLFGAEATGGEKAFTPLERAWIRPTIEINGICGGYSGEGFKTVIPAKAYAKVSCRLVPNQDPQKIGQLVARYFEENAPQGIRVHVHLHEGGGNAVRANQQSKILKAFSKAYEEVFEAPCQYIFSGGSIPVVTKLAEASESEILLLGLGLPDDQIHAPNEHFGLDRLEKGFIIVFRGIELLGKS
ncbi:dipeptidase [Parachlamydia sp. AcF125]|uniref:dipeptidase n=1 Tax=Parachlamydia sp. AcF125 TaxID=2795736 RepID=UPI001BC976A3|nr:dipeptidase [Parachlamydia sp. AcF125]MBS4167647.1 Succinyl-diaminopimelate desuccinylase [Parachlamydia sp. AcF125]